MPEERNEDGLTYHEWLAKLDGILASDVGVTSQDLPDTDTYTAWREGMSPEDHASDIIYDEFGDEDDDFDE